MFSARFRPSTDRYGGDPHRASARRRAFALFLTLAVHAIIVLLIFLVQTPIAPRKADDRMPVTFSLMPNPEKDNAPKSVTKAKKAAEAAPKAPLPPAPSVKPTPAVPPAAPPFMTMSRDDFAAADIGKMASQRGGGGTGGAGTGKVYGPGDGPGGAQIFDVDWYRHPTDAELSPYLPANRPTKGWGMVACRMIEHYHVENCQPIGESPIGSGFAKAVRLAAWQFLVKPPSINGKPQLGTWVRIRIDYSQRSAPEPPPPGEGPE